jgi:hypothetical protein
MGGLYRNKYHVNLGLCGCELHLSGSSAVGWENVRFIVQRSQAISFAHYVKNSVCMKPNTATGRVDDFEIQTVVYHKKF